MGGKVGNVLIFGACVCGSQHVRLQTKARRITDHRYKRRVWNETLPAAAAACCCCEEPPASLVGDACDFQLLLASGETKPDPLASPRIEQRFGDG